MKKDNADLLGRYDEAELVELGEADAYGGTAWACAGVTAGVTIVSSALCPTTKCTSKC
ncbi:class II lanthipeptide, LchA2/BrtA2 family [Streptomyces sp. NPDC053079]|uniref:class II lanthipeptide, LchA2/BrtA2 family n=1 Tax=Streptomyces sp. NPDC053079 TaxID=3365697 RepID=UPI0037D42254